MNRAVPLVIFLCPILLVACATSSTDLDRVAQRLLNDDIPEEQRAETARMHAAEASDLLTALADGMEPGTEDEYRRIPWLWRVSRAAGETNDDDVIREVLEVSLPQKSEPLHDWQAVVVGGGVVSGLYVAGEWPRERIDAIIAGDDALASRFSRTIDLSDEMADDASVPDPTRFDALLLVGMDDWASGSPQLIQYLQDGSEEELQMGAVFGIAAQKAPEADSVLVSHLDDLTPRNRRIAFEALLRTNERASTLLDAVESGAVAADSIGAERIGRLRDHPSEDIRRRARALLPGT